jgi:DNA gyrase/topoisomerase IV subunit B
MWILHNYLEHQPQQNHETIQVDIKAEDALDDFFLPIKQIKKNYTKDFFLGQLEIYLNRINPSQQSSLISEHWKVYEDGKTVLCSCFRDGEALEHRVDSFWLDNLHIIFKKSTLLTFLFNGLVALYKKRNILYHSALALRELVQKVGMRGIQVARFKGLGEMNPEDLSRTTLDPYARRLLRVTIQDGQKADRLFSILMGDDVPPRKNMIMNQSRNVSHDELDV